MNRLTFKNSIIFSSRMCGKTLFTKIYDKLSKLEDLEDELGCPLDVVFKALKEGFIDSEYNLLRTAKRLEYRDNEWVLVMMGCRGKQWYYPLKDYQKNWWLKGDME